MAVLSDEDRFAVWKEYMQIFPALEECGITKADVRAMINAQDTWLNDNAASANQAIPQPARSGLSNAQKARAMTLVIHKRYITGA